MIRREFDLCCNMDLEKSFVECYDEITDHPENAGDLISETDYGSDPNATFISTNRWNLEQLLKTHSVGENMVKIIGFHYRSSFEHGFKHGIEDASYNRSMELYEKHVSGTKLVPVHTRSDIEEKLL
jgi:hypothetical protein